MSSPYTLTPWTTLARPHPDVTSGALDMGTYAANLANVFRRRANTPPVYASAERFFTATFLTEGLRRLLTDTLRVLAGGRGDRVLQLRTPFGGGKTHTLVALLHLARDRGALAGDSQIADLPDPGTTRVAVLSGEELDPLTATTSTGTETRTLWGELGAQLGRYDLVAEHDRTGSAPGGDTLRRVLGDEPVLVLLDEVLVYVEKAMAVSRGESTLGRQAMLFVQALTEAVNSLPRAAMVYSLQASVGEAVGAEGLLSQLDHLVSRVDAKREPVTGDEVMRVVQRRLFTELGDESAHRAVAAAYAELLRRQLAAQAETAADRREATAAAARLEQRITASYPFHPALLDLMYHRWGSLPSYQRTRGALQFLASVVHAAWQARSTAPLIGPGEVDLADEATRGAFFSQVGERERFTSVLDADITSPGSGAAMVDRRIGVDSPGLDRLAVGTRMATAIMLYSFGSREGEDRGVLENDLVAATLVPGLDRNVVVAALHDLREEELYLHYTGRRYRFEPTPNLTKLVRDEANKLRADEVLDAVRAELDRQLTGSRGVVLWPAGPAAVRDRDPRFTLAYLHPDWSPETLPFQRFVEDAGSGKRLYRNALALVLPDRAQFDRARAAARLRLAAASLLGRRATYGFSAEQAEELGEKAAAAQRDLVTAVGRAYSHVSLPIRAASGSDRPYRMEEIDLRTILTNGRGLHQRVLEALSHRVFTSVTAAKLVSLSGVGPARPVVRCSELVDNFFSYFDFTKITDQRVIAAALANAVAAGELGYVVGLTETADEVAPREPSRVRFGEMLPVEEIDLSAEAAVIWAVRAAELTRPAREEDRPGPVGDGSDRHQPADRESSDHQPSGPGPAEAVRAFELRARVSKPGLFNLNRSLAWLRENADEVEVDLQLTARSGQGFDRVRLRNGVIEPLDEGGGDPEVKLS